MSNKNIKEKIIVFLNQDKLLNKDYKKFIEKNINQEKIKKKFLIFMLLIAG